MGSSRLPIGRGVPLESTALRRSSITCIFTSYRFRLQRSPSPATSQPAAMEGAPLKSQNTGSRASGAGSTIAARGRFLDIVADDENEYAGPTPAPSYPAAPLSGVRHALPMRRPAMPIPCADATGTLKWSTRIASISRPTATSTTSPRKACSRHPLVARSYGQPSATPLRRARLDLRQPHMPRRHPQTASRRR